MIPLILILKEKDESIFNCKLIFKYRPGTWEVCKERLSEHFKQNPSIRIEFQNVEEEYEKLRLHVDIIRSGSVKGDT